MDQELLAVVTFWRPKFDQACANLLGGQSHFESWPKVHNVAKMSHAT